MLYLHIPFCRRKCTYCAFYSVASRRGRDAYVEALCAELRSRATHARVRTVYFGGGTPSQLTIGQLQTIIETLRVAFDLSHLEEATLEANPDDLSTEYLSGLRDLHFFNRLSVGVQSFNDGELHAINRAHSGAQALEVLRGATDAGFDNISVDLIMGLPGQSRDSWNANLGLVATLPAVRHLSCYELTVEPGSILERQLKSGRISLPDEEQLMMQYDALQQWCRQHDFEQYEVSNYCRPGWHSRHNSRYWDRTPYMGFGAAAHSFDGQMRRWNIADVECYTQGALKGNVPYDEEQIGPTEAFNEYLMTALRTPRGVERAQVDVRYWDALLRSAQPFVREGLLVATDDSLRPTPSGLLHADGIAASLFRD